MDSLIRRLILLVLVLMALCGSIIAALATVQQRDFDLRGYVDATRIRDLPFFVPRLGVNADLTQYTAQELDWHLARMVDAGITWVRQPFPWNQIEPVQDNYDWTVWDQIVEAIDAVPELKLVAVLVNTPTWARADSDASEITTVPPSDPAQFAEFAQTVAQRYGHTIDYYQIWDEPNIALGWGDQPPRATEYVAMLQATYHAIHAADPGAVVITAALAPTIEAGPRNISDLLYLEDLLRLEAANFADAFAAKPYGFDSPPDDRTVDLDHLNFSRIVALREILTQYNAGDRALWASTWGWNSLPSDWSGSPSIWGEVTGDEQTAYTLGALDRAEREWPWLGGMILYHWQPVASPDDPLWGFSLIDQTGSPTPLWHALANRPQSTAATSGLHSPRSPYASYSGIWTFSEFGADMGWVQDSRFSFDFSGTDIALLLRKDDYIAYFYPEVDGQPANARPRDTAGNSTIMLRSGDLRPEIMLVPVARDLDEAPHRLDVIADELIPDDIVNRWPLVGFAVSPGDLAAPYNRQIVIALVTAAIAGVSVIMAAARIPWVKVFPPARHFWHRLTGTGQIMAGGVASLALLAGMFLTWGDGIPTLFRRDPVNLLLSVVTAGFIYLNAFGPILTIVAGLVLFVLIYNRLQLGLLLTIFWAPFFLFPVELYRFAFPMAEVMILLTFVAWTLRSIVAWGHNRRVPATKNPAIPIGLQLKSLSVIDYAMLTWVLVGLLSLTWAQRTSFAITELRTLIIEPAMFYVVLRTSVQDRHTITRLISALLLAGLVVAVIGLVLWIRGDAIITAEEGARRLASVYGSPNNAGLFLGRCIPFALALLLVGSNRRWQSTAGITLLVMLVAAALTQSAGAIFLGIPVSIAMVIVLVWRQRALLPLVALIVIGVIGLTFAVQMPRFARLVEFDQGTNFFRIRIWESSLNMIADHPVTGVGPDQFLYAFRGDYIMPDAWEEPDLSHPHNILLDVWLRLGLAGVALLAIFQTGFWRNMVRVYSTVIHEDRLLTAVTIGTMGSMANLLAHGLIDSSIFVNDLVYVFVLMLGLSVTLSTAGTIDDPATKMV